MVNGESFRAASGTGATAGSYPHYDGRLTTTKRYHSHSFTLVGLAKKKSWKTVYYTSDL